LSFRKQDRPVRLGQLHDQRGLLPWRDPSRIWQTHSDRSNGSLRQIHFRRWLQSQCAAAAKRSYGRSSGGHEAEKPRPSFVLIVNKKVGEQLLARQVAQSVHGGGSWKQSKAESQFGRVARKLGCTYARRNRLPAMA